MFSHLCKLESNDSSSKLEHPKWEGVDGVISLERIADTIFSMSNPDVICLQEVSRNCKLKDGTQPDQLNQLSNIFKGYEPFFGAAYDVLRTW